MKLAYLPFISLYFLMGCSQEPPKCSDESTLGIVKQIIINKITDLEDISQKDISDNIKFEFPRASAFNKEIKKFTCESKLVAGGTYQIPIQYESQFDDNNQHIVSVFGMLPGDFIQIKVAVGALIKVNNNTSDLEDPCKKIYEVYIDECINSSYIEKEGLSRISQSNFEFYSNMVTENKFFMYCKKGTEKPVEYILFKKDVCKQQKIISNYLDGNNIKNFEVDISENIIKTSRGNITIVKNDNGSYSINFNGKKYVIGDGSVSAASFNKRYKLNDFNIFTIGWSIGNSAEGTTLIIDKLDGIYIADLGYLKTIEVKQGNIFFETPKLYNRSEIIEFDGKKLTSNYNKNTNKWEVFNIKLQKIY